MPADFGPKKQIMIVAAEASSAHFAERLIQYYQNQAQENTGQDFHFFGVGTKSMESLGFERLGKSEEMAVVGAAEIVEAYGHLKLVFNSLVQAATERKPAVVIVMDYPEFNLMLSKKLHALGLPVVYYVSPQVWAWRKGRVFTIKKYCRKVLLLFPFEIPFYAAKEVPYEFVGHPILDEIDQKYFDQPSRKIRRARCGIGIDDFVIGLMPGSRRGEIKQHLEIQLKTARALTQKFPQVKFLLMVAPTLDREQLIEKIETLQLSESSKGLDFPLMIQQADPLEMIDLSDAVLAASGTATLMVGLLAKPMVIMYRMKWLTAQFARLVVRGVKFFGIVNLIFDSEIVPERFQEKANVVELTKLLEKLVVDKVHYQSVKTQLLTLQQKLGSPGATERVARALDEFL